MEKAESPRKNERVGKTLGGKGKPDKLRKVCFESSVQAGSETREGLTSGIRTSGGVQQVLED